MPLSGEEPHRKGPVRFVVLALVMACNPEIREAQRRHDALEAQVMSLEQELAGLREDMRAAGLRVDARKPTPQGRAKSKAKSKARGRRVGLQPKADHGEALGLRITRSGSLPAISIGAAEPIDAACGFRLQVPDLKRISDFQLTQRGKGKASPVRLSVDGAPLKPHAFPKEFSACVGAFRHAGTVVLFSPPQTGEPGTLELSFATDFPSPRADGRPLYWVHPGQHAEVTTTEPWDESWGSAILQVDADAETPPTLTLDGSRIVNGDALPGTGPWTIRIEAQSHTLLDTVVLGNPQHGATLTSPEKWRAQR